VPPDEGETVRTYVTRVPREVTPSQRRLVDRAAAAYQRHLGVSFRDPALAARYREAVRQARVAGVTLQAPADGVGVSRQAIHRTERSTR